MPSFDAKNDIPPMELLIWARSHGYGNSIYKEVSVRLATEADGFTLTEMVDESGDVEMIPVEIGDGPSQQRFYIGKIDWFVTGMPNEKAFFCWAINKPNIA